MKVTKLVGAFWVMASSAAYAGGLEMGALWRGELSYNDNKMSKAEGADDPATSTMLTGGLELMGEATLNDKVSFSFLVDASNGAHCGGTPIKMGYATVKFTDMIDVKMGCMKINQGGWDGAGASIHTLGGHTFRQGHYAGFAPAAELGFNLMNNRLAFQVTNDVATAGEAASVAAAKAAAAAAGTTYTSDRWRDNTQRLGWTVAYTGEFGPVQPRIEYVSYDQDHSNSMNFGVMASVNNLSLSFDYLMHNRSFKTAKTDGKGAESKEDKSTTMILYASYSVPEMVTPYFGYAMFDKKQHTDDWKGSMSTDLWGDNGMAVTVGTTIDCIHESFQPFAEVNYSTAKVLKDDANVTGDTNSRSGMELKLGAIGTF